VQTLKEKTVCGDTWTIAASATEVVLTYPLTSCSDADDSFSQVSVNKHHTYKYTMSKEIIIY
jgi:hypothetical protein